MMVSVDSTSSETAAVHTQPIRVVFVSALGESAASFRMRVAKLVPLLRARGLTVDVVKYPSLEAAQLPAKIWFHNREQRWIVIFQKHAVPSLARLVSLAGAVTVLDLDDGGWENLDGSWLSEREQRRWRRGIECPDAVVASCEELRKWVSQWNGPVHVIPTCLDVDAYSGLSAPNTERCTLGWVGFSPHVLLQIEEELSSVCERSGCRLLIIGSTEPKFETTIPYEFVKWRLDLEPSVFGKMDIGIMPLPLNNERSRMKAGFKLLQYMAAGLPVVASPVGVNSQIISHGQNGFLAETASDWKRCLGELIESASLRQEMGKRGRQFVGYHFRMERAADDWLEVIEELAPAVSRQP